MPNVTFGSPPSPPPPPPPERTISTRLWPQMLAAGKHRELCEQFILAFEALGRSLPFERTPAAMAEVDQILNHFFAAMRTPEFLLSTDLVEGFVRLNRPIAALAAISRFGTTDQVLQSLGVKQENFLKILALYSARNSPVYDRRSIFGTSGPVASLWYMRFAESFRSSVASPAVEARLREHFAFVPTLVTITAGMHEGYLGPSFVDPEIEEPLKLRMNQAVQECCATESPRVLDPDRRRIAIVSAHWNVNDSVHRIMHGLLSRLRPRYHLTFLRLGSQADQDLTLFDESHVIRSQKGVPDMALLRQGRFGAILYPDIGMSDESIVLANMRFAPLQITFNGHPVSTFGADIDYFISGAAAERPDHPEQHYSERLVLLPGMGCVHAKPAHKRKFSPRPASEEKIVINCPWSAPRINSRLVEAIRTIAKRATRPVQFRIFPGRSLRAFQDQAPFEIDFYTAIGRDVAEIVYELPYGQYMETMERAQFTLDSFHFGGCNSVSDALHLRLPIVCLEGNRWHNRIGPAMLRMIGMGELIAGSQDEYLAIAHRMIHDDPWRDSLRVRIQNADLDSTIYSTADAGYFTTALDYLFANHARLRQERDRLPVRIPAE